MPYEGKLKEVYIWLKEKKEDFAIIEFPLESIKYRPIPYGLDKGYLYNYSAAFHNKKVFNGRSGYFPPLYRYVKSVPFWKQIEIAKAINIKYLVIHKDIYLENKFLKNTLDSIIFFLENKKEEFLKVYEDDKSLVYEILSPNKNFNPEKTYIKDYNFSIWVEKKDNLLELIFRCEDENPCIFLYKNILIIEFYKEEKVIKRDRVIFEPNYNNCFLLKGEKFKIYKEISKLKKGRYLIKIFQDKKLIRELSFEN